MADPARAKSLFLAASDIPDPAQRSAYLKRECGDDAELRERVEELLRASSESSAADATVTFDSTPSTGTGAVFAGQTVIAGRYTLLNVIGQGGMGSVYRAEQTRPVKRQVALKLIKLGMDSKAVLARFDAERQALAMMDHPNIARVYDGGTTQHGQPYFVMELVAGVPLTQYCDQQRLGVKARLELFVSVCKAVQHAHQKGIIHRDLKPGNVLVTEVDGRPTPKVIDFGVAKATEQKLTDISFADTGAIVGTPAYMSPEQADPSSMDIDTRTDVYALGVMLYELLVGSPPIDSNEFKRGAIMEMLRMVREVDPPKPSTRLSAAKDLPNVAANRNIEPAKLTRLFQGELDWVVMKALEKDRNRRYDTVNGLARDIERYLGDEAVEARPPSMGYRLRKFVRRNKGRVIAASVVFLALVGGIVGTTMGLFEARKQTQFAQGETAKKDDANKELKHRLGVSAMVLAAAAYDNRDVKLAAERLENVPVEQRGWEWKYLKQQVRGGIFTIQGHKAPVTSVAYSPDGTRIVTATGGQNEQLECKMWDARTGAFLFELRGLPAQLQGVNIPLAHVAFSADGSRLVTSGGDIARVWDAKSGALQLELADPIGTIKCAAFSPDSAQVVTACDAGNGSVIKICDARTGNSLLDWKAQRLIIRRVSYSPDGERIVTGCQDKSVKVWDVKTGKMLLDVKGIMNYDSSVAFSPDGTRLVAGREDGSARVIDAKTGAVMVELKTRPRPLQLYYGTTGVLTVAFSPDGTRIVTGGGFGDGEASVWDARTGMELLELKGHTSLVLSAAFSPDGNYLVTGSFDGMAKVWDARTGTPRLDLEGLDTWVHSASFSRDDTQIVIGGGVDLAKPGAATVLDARTGSPLLSLQSIKWPVKAAAFSPDGARIITGGGTGDVAEGELAGEAIIWDKQTGKPLFELKGLRGAVTSVAFSPDGSQIATGGGEAEQNQYNEVKLWDARTGAMQHDLSGSSKDGFVFGVKASAAFNHDGTRLAATTAEGWATVWDPHTGKAMVQLEKKGGKVVRVAFSRDGARIVGCTHNMTAIVWDAHTGRALLELKGHTGHLLGAAFSPDGTRIITGSMDRTVRMWDARTGTTLLELRGFSGQVSSVSFSSDGSRILTAGFGDNGKLGEVIVWDARVLPDNVQLLGHTEHIFDAVFSPDGTRIATGSDDKTVKLWDARTGTCLLDLKDFKWRAHALSFSPDSTRIVTADGEDPVKVWDAKTGEKLTEIKASPHRVAFSTDGTQVITESGDNMTPTLWDAKTGKELPASLGQPVPGTFRSGRTSPDRRFFAKVDDNRVEVVPLDGDTQEIAYRRRHTEPDIRHHREAYRAARAARDDFAAAFHLNLVPPDQRKELLAQADADALKALTELAQENQRAGKRDEAIPLYAEILKITRAKLGAEDPATIQAVFRLGLAYYQARRFDEAIPLMADVVKYREGKIGLEHPETTSAIGILAMALKEAGKLQEAIQVLEVGGAKGTTGMFVDQLIELHLLAKEHAKALDLLLKQFAEVRKAQPDARLYHADFLGKIGRCCLALKKWTEAELHLRECVTIREKENRDAWETFDAGAMLGAALLGQKNYTDAEPLLLKGYEGMKQRRQAIPPQEIGRLAEAIDRLIELYTVTNKADEVKKWQGERAKYSKD